MRFPITFMGLVSAGAGVWAIGYLAANRPSDPVAAGTAVAGAVLLIGFGAYILIRRLLNRPAG
jgi:putative Mn2+ efflux pump MntP